MEYVCSLITLVALLVSTLSLTVAIPTTQVDNQIEMLHSEKDNTEQFSANLSRVENRLNHHLKQAERRIIDYLEDRIKPLNQTLAVAQMERMFFMVYEQQEYAKEAIAEQEKELDRLRSSTTQQEEEMRRMRASLDAVRSTVSQLSAQVQVLQRAAQDDGGVTASEINTKPTPAVDRKYPTDCQDVFSEGTARYQGNYFILIQPDQASEAFKACCKMTNDSGWTVIQRRQDGSVDFFRNWEDYKNGFGDLDGEFWLGNQHIYQLTNQGDYMLRIEMVTWDGHPYWAEYDHFSISSELDMYRLHVHGYHGNGGDSLTSDWENHDNQPFSTYDHDNDDRFYDNCAKHYKGAWWFKSCFESHLNGQYYHKGAHDSYFVRDGVQWNSIHVHSSLKETTMMIKPNPNVSEHTRKAVDERWVNGIH